MSASSTNSKVNTDAQAYKKAFRQHLNNKQSHHIEWTPFRTAEKRFKAKFPPPDLDDVLDLSRLESDNDYSVTNKELRGGANTVSIRSIGLKSDHARSAVRKAYAINQIPGLVILPKYLDHAEQRSLARWCLSDQARAPNDTNLDIHYVLPKQGLWNLHMQALRDQSSYDEASSSRYIIQPKRPTGSEPAATSLLVGPRQLIDNIPAEISNFDTLYSPPKPTPIPSSHLPPTHVSKLLPKLRWANIGYSYHWGSKTYDFSRPKAKYPQEVRNICKDVVASLDWHQVWDGADAEDWGEQGPVWKSWSETYEPDAGIVNFYQPKDTLCAHVDRSEVCSTSPLVSISLGNSAVFLIGGLSRSVEPIPILLRSGDVIIMSGPSCRRAYHGVPRIFEGTSPMHLQSADSDGDWQPFAQYLRTTRININVRQVFPRGFDPFVGSG